MILRVSRMKGYGQSLGITVAWASRDVRRLGRVALRAWRLGRAPLRAWVVLARHRVWSRHRASSCPCACSCPPVLGFATCVAVTRLSGGWRC